MTDLEKLTVRTPEHITAAIRLGYALGYRHGDDARESDIDPDAPEFRALDDLGFE